MKRMLPWPWSPVRCTMISSVPYGAVLICRPRSERILNGTHVFVHVQKRNRPRVLDGVERVRILLDDVPTPSSTTVGVTSSYVLGAWNRNNELRRALSALAGPGDDDCEEVRETILVDIS